MFTLTFVRSPSNQGATSKCVLSAARYSVINAGERTSIWVYPTLKAENPVLIDLHKDEDDNTYYELFVTNEHGRTIDRHRAIQFPEAQA